MRDLDPARAEPDRQGHHLVDAADIGAMHDDIHREGNFQTHDVGGQRALSCKGAVIAGDVVGALLLAVLNRNLHVIETGIAEPI